MMMVMYTYWTGGESLEWSNMAYPNSQVMQLLKNLNKCSTVKFQPALTKKTFWIKVGHVTT
jgi:hypothetical protein